MTMSVFSTVVQSTGQNCAKQPMYEFYLSAYAYHSKFAGFIIKMDNGGTMFYWSVAIKIITTIFPFPIQSNVLTVV